MLVISGFVITKLPFTQITQQVNKNVTQQTEKSVVPKSTGSILISNEGFESKEVNISSNDEIPFATLVIANSSDEAVSVSVNKSHDKTELYPPMSIPKHGHIIMTLHEYNTYELRNTQTNQAVTIHVRNQ